MADDQKRTEPRSNPRRRSAARFSVLRIVHSPDRSAVDRGFPFDGSAYEFGRSGESPHPIDDDRLSRRHFRVDRGRAGYLIEDLDSTNGTFLDGRAVHGRVPLEGQVISAGDTLFVVDPAADLERLPSGSGVFSAGVRGLVGESNAMKALRDSVATVGPQRAGVLLLGPTGAGKEVTAEAIHHASQRTGPFVAVNCAAIPSHLAESELFGHEKGAFTGADMARPGAFRASSGGTLFLDEVGDLPAELQPKLLRALETSSVQPLGGTRPVPVDLRVVAATHRTLHAEDFRQDLLARLCDWVLHLPALAERKADIPALWRHFLAEETSGHRWREDPEAMEALLLYDWPMNVRELRKLVRRLVVLAAETRTIDLDVLPAALAAPVLKRDGAEFDEIEDEALPQDSTVPNSEELKQALAEARGNVSRLARSRGWHRNQVNRWLKKHEIDPSQYR